MPNIYSTANIGINGIIGFPTCSYDILVVYIKLHQ